jgi:penicillin-binding protein 1C
MAVLPSSGDHVITVMDELGNELKHNITISE